MEMTPGSLFVVYRFANEDPITHVRGAHPVGVGTGAAGGGLAGAGIGAAIAGPVGAAVGVVVGALSGAFAGKSAAEVLNPTDDRDHWRYDCVL